MKFTPDYISREISQITDLSSHITDNLHAYENNQIEPRKVMVSLVMAERHLNRYLAQLQHQLTTATLRHQKEQTESSQQLPKKVISLSDERQRRQGVIKLKNV